MKRLIIPLALLFLLGFLFSGCASSEDFKKQQLHIDNIQKELDDTNEQIRLNQMEMQRLLGQTREGMPSMRQEIDRMRDDLQRLNDGVESANIEGTVPEGTTITLKNRLDHIGARLDRIEARLKLPPLPISTVIEAERADQQAVFVGHDTPSIEVPEESPQTSAEDDAFNAAKQLFTDKAYPDAVGAFRQFLTDYPESKFAPSAQFYIGESLYQQEKYEEAILEYQKIIQTYPKSSKIPPALLKQAYSFLAIGDNTSGKLLLRKIIRAYPNTSAADVAKKKLATIN